MESLTEKQQAFVNAYLGEARGNGVQAAKLAGYKGNDRTLSVVAAENLTKPCITRFLQENMRKAAQKAEKQAVNVYTEFQKNLAFVSKLRDAAEKWLMSPETDEFSLVPRGDEIDIIYFDFEDRDQQSNPKRKTACLQEVLAKLQGTRYESDTQFVKTVDLRDYALKTVDRIDMTLDKFAKMGGAYTKEGENPNTIEKVLSSFTLWLEKNPNANAHQKADAIRDFASFGKVDEAELGRRAGVEVQVIEVTQ